MADVFISYSRKDREFANELVNALAKDKRDVWVDWQDIPRGEDWLNEIKTGIENADTFVLIVSQNSLTSEICHYEIEHARNHNKRIIPVILETIEGTIEREIKTQWIAYTWGKIASDNWKSLSHINWIIAIDTPFDKMFRLLIQTIETDIMHVRLHTRFEVRALDWKRSNENPSFLLRGDEIVAADDWLKKAAHKDPAPTTLHGEYILASFRREGQEKRRLRNLRLTIFVAIIAVILAIVGAMFVTAYALTSVNTASTAQVESTGVRLQVIEANNALTQIPATIEYMNGQSRLIEQQVINANATLTQIPPTLDAIQTGVAQGESDNYSINLAVQAQEVFPVDRLLGLTLALESNLVVNPPLLAQTTLSEFAYAPGLSLYIPMPEIDPLTVAFSHDGRYIIAGSDSYTIYQWDAITGEEIRRYRGHTNQVTAVAFSPDGTQIISGSRDNTIIIWDVGTGAPLMNLSPRDGTIQSLAFSPDGSRFVSGSADGRVRVWDTEDGTSLLYYSGHNGGVESVTVSPDGTQILSSSPDSTKLYSIANRGQLMVFTGTADFSPDGTQVIAGNTLYDIETGEALQHFGEENAQVTHVAFSPDGVHVLIDLTLWDIANNQASESLLIPGNNITDIVYSPDGTRVAVSERDGIFIWDLGRGDLEQSLHVEDMDITTVQFMPDNERVIAGASNTPPIILDIETGDIVTEFEPAGEFSLSPDGSRILIESTLYDVATGAIITEFEWRRNRTATTISPDGTRIAIGLPDATIELWDVASGTRLQIFEGHLNPVNSLDFSPDGRQIVSGSTDSSVRLWDSEREQIFTGHVGRVNQVVFSPYGTQVVSASDDGTVRLWDVATLVELQRFIGHDGGVISADITPDGYRVVSASDDGTVRLWDVATGLEITRFEGSSNVAFSPDGTRILSLSADNRIKLWRNDYPGQLITWTINNRATRDLTCDERIRYSVLPHCDAGMVLPSPTLLPTRTPSN